MSNIKISVENNNLVLKPLRVTKAIVPNSSQIKQMVLSDPVTVHEDSNATIYQQTYKPGTSTSKRGSGSGRLAKVFLARDNKGNDVVYQSVKGDFFKGNTDRSMTITHGFDPTTKSIRTRACITKAGEKVTEITSDNFVSAIGQYNYETVFKALVTVPSEELKVQAILALLAAKLGDTTEKKSLTFHETNENEEKFEMQKNFQQCYELDKVTSVILPNGMVTYVKSVCPSKSYETKSCQTNESAFYDINLFKTRKAVRRAHKSPYAVTDQLLQTRNKETPAPANVQSDIKTLSMEKDYDVQSLKFSCNTSFGNLSCFSKNTDELIKQITNSNVFLDPTDHTGEINPSEPNKTQSNEEQNIAIWNTKGSVNSAQVTSLVTPSNSTCHINTNLSHVTLPSFQSRPSLNDSTRGQTSHDSYPQTQQYPIKMWDGYEILVPVKPEDHFHLATPENLRCLSPEDKRKLIMHQICIDVKYALIKDEDGFLPIHKAVDANDVDWLRRQAAALKTRGETVDIVPEEEKLVTDNQLQPSTKGKTRDMLIPTALQMSLYQDTPDCCSALLELGADPLLADSEGRAILHLAAERGADHLHAILHMCKQRARAIMSEHEEVRSAGWSSMPDGVLAQSLMDHMCTMVDDQGYTPLMLASKIGNYTNTQLLAEESPRCVDYPMPNSGNTALYLAIGAACMDAADRGNKSQVSDQFSKTIETLIQKGANILAENYAGSNPHTLVQEFQNSGLQLLISNLSLTHKNDTLNNKPESLMLVKDQDGNCYDYSEWNKKRETLLTQKRDALNKNPESLMLVKDQDGNCYDYSERNKKIITERYGYTLNKDVHNTDLVETDIKKAGPTTDPEETSLKTNVANGIEAISDGKSISLDVERPISDQNLHKVLSNNVIKIEKANKFVKKRIVKITKQSMIQRVSGENPIILTSHGISLENIDNGKTPVIFTNHGISMENTDKEKNYVMLRNHGISLENINQGKTPVTLTSHGISMENIDKGKNPVMLINQGISMENIDKGKTPVILSSHGISMESIDKGKNPVILTSHGISMENLEKGKTPVILTSHGISMEKIDKGKTPVIITNQGISMENIDMGKNPVIFTNQGISMENIDKGKTPVITTNQGISMENINKAKTPVIITKQPISMGNIDQGKISSSPKINVRANATRLPKIVKPITIKNNSIKVFPSPATKSAVLLRTVPTSQVEQFKRFKLVNKQLVDRRVKRNRKKINILKDTVVKKDDPIIQNVLEQYSNGKANKFVIQSIGGPQDKSNNDQTVVQSETRNNSEIECALIGSKRMSETEDGLHPKKIKKS